MENRQQQILAEIQSMMASIRNQLNVLDAKISEFQQITDLSGNQAEPIDLEPIDFFGSGELVAENLVSDESLVEAPVAEEDVADEPIEDEPLVEEQILDDPATEEVKIEEPVIEEPVAADDDLPFFEEESVEVAAPIIDMMTDKQAWRTDMPGGAVRDVRSAISLNDRILFINKLFDEDPIAFQAAIGRINSMESLDEVIAYVNAEHSDWNLESDTVYRFMMAVRRKVR